MKHNHFHWNPLFSGKNLFPVSFIWNSLREYINEHIFKTNGLPHTHLNIPTKSLSDQETNEINQREKGAVETTLLYGTTEE